MRSSGFFSNAGEPINSSGRSLESFHFHWRSTRLKKHHFISKEVLEDPPVAHWRCYASRAVCGMKIISSVLIAGILLLTQASRADVPTQARADNARLIVNRSADFGINESINLAIDGVPVAVLGI